MLSTLRKKLASKNGTLECNRDKCVLCGDCEKVCPVNAIKVDKEAELLIIDHNKCWSCSKCVRKCKHNALSLKK